jgi:hypothetical protein
VSPTSRKMERFVGGDVTRITDQRLDHSGVCDDTRSVSVKGSHRVACVGV